jgi:UDP-N-acetylmuramoyl-tripeptide--D-alanyl-D-alanine ligase
METVTNADGVTVINDAYNANPDSMRSALETLAEIGRRRGGARTFAVLGEMCELGETSLSAHESLGRLVADLGISRLVTVGPAAAAIAAAASEQHAGKGEWRSVPDAAAAREYLTAEVGPGDVVLVKASRAAGLEAVADVLLAQPTAAR